MDSSFILQILMNGMSLSMTYALIAVGLTLIFGVVRILNFAHGELLMVGGFVMWVLFTKNDVPFPVAAVAAMFAVGGLALAIERGLFKRTRANPFMGLVISIALVGILQVSALLLFGVIPHPSPAVIPGEIEIWGTSFNAQRLVLIPAIAGVMVLVWVLLERTRFGRAVRACIQDSEAASLQGISLDRMSAIIMFIGGALAGLAGALLCLTVPAGPYLGTFVILKAFIVVIIGGMGSVGGTIVAAFIFGFLDSTISTLVDPRLAIVAGVVLMLVVLAIRPRGLFGRE